MGLEENIDGPVGRWQYNFHLILTFLPWGEAVITQRPDNCIGQTNLGAWLLDKVTITTTRKATRSIHRIRKTC